MIQPGTDLWVGVDIGTQSVRVVIVSSSGTLLARGAAPVSSVRAIDRHEQDPSQWWQALQAAAAEATAQVDRSAIRGLAACGTSGTILLADKTGFPITAGLMYDDTRAVAEADEASQAGARLWRRLGYQRMQPAWALPKLMWALRNVAAPRGARLFHQADYINAKLAGVPVATDTSNALKTGCDLTAEDWPSHVMNDLGVPLDVLPPVVRSGTQIATVSEDAARRTGIPRGTPIHAGMTDGCAAQLGAGVVAVGDWNCVLGTTLVLKGVADSIAADSTGAVYSHRSPDGRWLPGGASSCGAGAIARELPGRDLDALTVAAREHLPSSVLTYPLAGARGERFPFVEPTATPFYIGQPRDDDERYAALIQAIAFVERLSFDHLGNLGLAATGRRVLSGGAVRAEVVNQLRADVMGHPVTVTEHADGALGMAVLAAANSYGIAEAAAAMVHVSRVVEPRHNEHTRYTEKYTRFVASLERRGWLPPALAESALQEAGQ